MKRISVFILILILSVCMLFSCKNEDDAPEGLQTADINEDEGYIFYAPENWSVINANGISAAKVSPVNNTSITFTRAPSPVGTIPEYFDDSLNQLSSTVKNSLNLILRDEKCTFGNADGECLKYIYTYKYEDFSFACMQILVNHGGGFYIFTYTSYGDVNDEASDYRAYLTSVQLAIDSFVFDSSLKADKASTEYIKDSDGYNLVSDKKLSGFELYLPEDFDVLYSDAYVKAKISDSANLSLSKATSTGVSIMSYWEMRKSELSRFVTDIEEVEVNRVNDPTSDNKDVIFGNLDSSRVASYEYIYTFNGKRYHVYQVMGVDSLYGYVFTYTALEDEYAEHIDEIKTILRKVRF